MKKLSLLFALAFASISVFAADITITPDVLAKDSAKAIDQTYKGVNIKIGQGTITSDQIRCFKNQTMTLSVASGKITKVVITATANGTAKYGPGCFTGAGYTAGEEKTGEWTGSASSVELKAESNQVRMTEIVVTVDGGTDPGDDPGDEPGELTYDYEPSTPTQIEGVLTYGEFTNYLEEGVIELYFESDDYVVSLLAFSNNSWSTIGGIGNGNWDINDSQENGTILASPGGDEEADYPSFVGADIDDEGYYNTSYYLASGYVNVMPASDNPERDGVKFEINAVSHFGTTIKLTYTGIVKEVEPDDTAVENVEAKPQFDENAPMYNAAGQRVNKDFRGVIIQKGGKFMLSK